MNPINNGALGERTSKLEARMDIQEKKTDKLAEIADKLTNYMASSQGEKEAVNDMHKQNRERMNIQIALLGLLLTLMSVLFAYETLKDHRQSRNNPAVQHSDMPAGYEESVTR